MREPFENNCTKFFLMGGRLNSETFLTRNAIKDRGSTALYTAYTDDTLYTVNIVQTALH